MFCHEGVVEGKSLEKRKGGTSPVNSFIYLFICAGFVRQKSEFQFEFIKGIQDVSEVHDSKRNLKRFQTPKVSFFLKNEMHNKAKQNIKKEI